MEELSYHIDRLVSGEPSWVAVLGRRKIGKTSLMLELGRRMGDETLRFVILDTFERTGDEIFRLLGLRTVDCLFSKELGLSLESISTSSEEYRRALIRSDLFLGLDEDIRSRVHGLADVEMEESTIAGVLDLPERLAKALGVRIVLAWDEFQEVDDRWLGLVRARWQNHREVAYLIAGSSRSMMEELVLSGASPFFQHFHVMTLDPFDEENARRLLVSSDPDAVLDDSLAGKVYAVMGGHPFYLQIVGEALTRLGPPYDEEAIKETLQEVLFSRTGRLSLYFEREHARIVGRSTYLSATLQSMASGPKPLSVIATDIGAASGATVRYVERLGDAARKLADGRYGLVDPTFALWIRWRAPGGTVVPMSLLGDEAEKVVAARLASMGFDLVYQSRASRGAFDLLATRGTSHLGVQVKRRAIPLSFPLDEWNRMEAESCRLGWSWIVAAVSPRDDSVCLMDPSGGRKARIVRLDEEARIQNLLQWVDETSS